MGDDALEKASDVFVYDETSPSGLRWKEGRYGGRNYSVLIVPAGAIAGCLQTIRGQKKWRVRFNKSLVFCHNIIWELCKGPVPEGFVVDHFDGATEHNKIGNFRLVTQPVNTRNAGIRKDNSSGVTGVRLTGDGTGKHFYWTAMWREENRKRCKHYPIRKLGNDQAFRLACEHRAQMIEQLNAQGAGYTERHGTAKEAH